MTYMLSEEPGGTRIAQHDDAQLGAPRFLHPFMKVGIGRGVAAS